MGLLCYVRLDRMSEYLVIELDRIRFNSIKSNQIRICKLTRSGIFNQQREKNGVNICCTVNYFSLQQIHFFVKEKHRLRMYIFKSGGVWIYISLIAPIAYTYSIIGISRIIQTTLVTSHISESQVHNEISLSQLSPLD